MSSTTPPPRPSTRSTPPWRRKAIPRSDSPWTPRDSGRKLPAPSGSRGRRYSTGQGGWLIGPTWLYVALAVAIFIAAAAVAIVQATGSDDESSAVAEQAQAAQQARPAQQASQDDPAAQTQVAETQVAQAQTTQAQTAEQPSAAEAVEDESAQEEEAQPAPIEPEVGPLEGFIVPIAGACITEFETHLPSSNRAYRNNGTHEGLDFYQWASCTVIDLSTPILAAKDGVVIRADLDYVDITPADWARFEAANWEGEAILDELRGRQVYIDHGRGVVTRYAHLSSIAQGIGVGVEVRQGQVIGYPGESGQREVYTDENDIHLHFEIRVGDTYLGQGESPQTARLRYLEAFGLGGN